MTDPTVGQMRVVFRMALLTSTQVCNRQSGQSCTCQKIHCVAIALQSDLLLTRGAPLHAVLLIPMSSVSRAANDLLSAMFP